VLLRYLHQRYTASRLYGAEAGALAAGDTAPAAESDAALAAAAATGDSAQVLAEPQPVDAVAARPAPIA
jgi:hypothetical protein